MTRYAACIAGALGVLLCAAPARSQATIGGEWRDDVAAFARRIVDARLTPGMAVAVSQRDWVLYSQGFGVADPDGTAFSYDNLPYNILGFALDPASKEGWKDVVRRDVLDPLGMRGTSARISTMEPERIALPHTLTPAGWRRVLLAKRDANQHAAGGHFAAAQGRTRARSSVR